MGRAAHTIGSREEELFKRMFCEGAEEPTRVDQCRGKQVLVRPPRMCRAGTEVDEGRHSSSVSAPSRLLGWATKGTPTRVAGGWWSFELAATWVSRAVPAIPGEHQQLVDAAVGRGGARNEVLRRAAAPGPQDCR